ncbi:hypothetical protein [Mycolicibacterium llatzerense]|uniref:hypothetical protein n=1 Tax=Mycolicibacterium llatzerense TaxID=280871 RepID=UPI0021B4E0B5|nr:hypothetical protein [Mycolicibacterium llatzerense]MCT7372148.1 hypothetical protein [Mycolicibacterium llatzerense]
MNKNIRWSPEVRDLLGLEALQTLCRTADEYNCVSCRQPGRALLERSHLVVITNDGPPIVQLAHRWCMESQVIAIDSDLLDLNNPNADLSEDVNAVTVLWPGTDGPLAGLIIDRSDAFGVVNRATGDTHDPFVSFLLGSGWAMVASTEQGFPVVDTGGIDLDHPGGRVLTYRPQTVLLDPLPTPDEAWIAAARERGVVRVYAGAVGLKKAAGQPLYDVMDAAISAGRIAGSYLPVQPSASRD